MCRPRTYLVCCLAWMVFLPTAPGQDKLSDEHSSLLLERDRKAKRAVALANQGEFDEAQALLDQVFQLEQSVFGEVHAELIGTLDMRAQVAKANQNWNDAVEYRRRAHDMGQAIYREGDYRRRDLELEWSEARADAKRTDAQRLELAKATWRTRQVVALHSQGKYADAIKLAESVLETRRQLQGRDHQDYARSQNNLAQICQQMGDLQRAEKLQVEANEIERKVLGKNHPRFARGLNNLSNIYHSQGRYQLAADTQSKSNSIVARTLGKNDSQYALGVNNLAEILRKLGDYSQAELLYTEAKDLSQRLHGMEHATYAASVHNLGNLYSGMGDYTRAKPLLIEAKSIRERVLGKSHPDYAATLDSLAGVYLEMGDYSRAEKIYVTAKEIRKTAFGTEHHNYAASLNNLATLYRSVGDFARAEPLLVESDAICRRVLRKEHPDFIKNLMNQANFYDETGDRNRASALLLECTSAAEKALGKNHPDYASVLKRCAHVRRNLGDLKQAEALYRSALAIQEKRLGQEHPELASSLNGLAYLYILSEDYSRAETLLTRSMSIREKIFGANHPIYAESANNLATVSMLTGDFARSEKWLIKSIGITKDSLGAKHPTYATYLANLAALYVKLDDHHQAAPLLAEATAITMSHLETLATVQTQKQQLLMNRSVRYQLDNLLACCVSGKVQFPESIARTMGWKGSILLRQRNMRLLASDPEISDQFATLRSLTSRITAMQNRPVPRQIEPWKQQLAELNAEKDSLERKLVRESTRFREAFEQVSFDAIRDSLPEDAVLIDFIEFNERKNLVASVIKSQDAPKLIWLGSVLEAGKRIDTWRTTLGSSTESRLAGRELREQIWAPLLEDIGDANLVLISTDGVLGRMPFAALPGEKEGTYLLEDHRLAFIPVPKMLPALVKKAPSHGPPASMLVMGNVDFDSRPEPTGNTPPDRTSITISRSRQEDTSFSHLPGTASEIVALKSLFEKLQPNHPLAVLEKSHATEDRFRRLAPKHSTLHLATHGFFAPADKALPSTKDKRTIEQRMIMTDQADQADRVRGSQPGRLSGLAFAGANRDPEPNQDDGIMVADEIAFLPLEQADLVVLSACETGLGEVAGGEGLLGIQRAFQIAGARTTVASLWKVPDQATDKLMQRFYQNLWERRMPRLDALRDAQLAMLDGYDPKEGTLRGAPRDRKPLVPKPERDATRTDPQFWAAFQLSGDWR